MVFVLPAFSNTVCCHSWHKACCILSFGFLPVLMCFFILVWLSFPPQSRSSATTTPWSDSLASIPLSHTSSLAFNIPGLRSGCGRYAVFVLHSANWDYTQHVLASLSEYFGDQVFLIDMSFNEETWSQSIQLFLQQHHINVLYPHAPLMYSQGIEFLRRVAFFESNLDFILFSHNDAHFVNRTRSVSVRQEIESHICTMPSSWGTLSFTPQLNIDTFCAFNGHSWKAIGMWDPYIVHYSSDFDYHYRMVQSGFTEHVRQLFSLIISHHVGLTASTITQRTPEEQYGYSLHNEISMYVYYLKKWGTTWTPNERTSPLTPAYRLPWDGQTNLGKPQLFERWMFWFFLWKYAPSEFWWLLVPSYCVFLLLCCCVIPVYLSLHFFDHYHTRTDQKLYLPADLEELAPLQHELEQTQ